MSGGFAPTTFRTLDHDLTAVYGMYIENLTPFDAEKTLVRPQDVWTRVGSKEVCVCI